jgi:hypothetical protein
MKRAIATFVLAGLTVASAAFAVEFTTKAPLPNASQVEGLLAILACDNGTPSSAYFQDDTGRYGNRFSFGGGASIKTLTFAHFGFGFSGPYNYDIEFYDPASCTIIDSVDGLVAADAASAVQVEVVDLCPENIVLSGDVLVTIDSNSCLDPTDCYPDVLFDTQVGVFCPYVVFPAAFACFDVSAQSGPFLLRVETDCPGVPVAPKSWGSVKQIYR